jgi:hypothetical protein
MKKHHVSENLAHVEDGNVHAVATALRVLISPADAGGFVAQGLEIDYVATGKTVEEVQDHFVRGLLRTIESLIRRNRPLSALFKSRTPPEAWQAFMNRRSEDQDTLECGMVVDLRNRLPENAHFPFGAIAYCRTAELSHA